MFVARRAISILAVVIVAGHASRALAQSAEYRRRLAEVIQELVPYDLEGSTLDAFDDLEALAEQVVDPRVRATATFLRGAAAFELTVYGRLRGDAALLSAVADAMRTEPEGLEQAIVEALLDAGVTGGVFRTEAADCRLVLECLRSPEERSCESDLRAVAARRGAASTAARLVLIDRMANVAARTRGVAALDARSTLASVAGQLCEEATAPEVTALCREAEAAATEEDRLGTWVRLVARHLSGEVEALEVARAGGDPLAELAAYWVAEAERHFGWTIVRDVATAQSVEDLALPPARSESRLPPLELLVVRRDGAAVALAPSTVETLRRSIRLDEQLALALPGRPIDGLPRRFRPAIRPIGAVTEALRALRREVDRAVEPLGDGESWFRSSRSVLGLLVDGDVSLVDLARYVASARRAGYDRFVLLGRRADGRLATIPARFASPRERATRRLPMLRVSPRDVRFVPTDGAPIEVERAKVADLAPMVVAQLGDGPYAFAASARPMMPYRMVLPSIDAVVAAASERPPEVLFMLP